MKNSSTARHTHHQFGEEIPCDLPDTYEAHYGPRTTDDNYRLIGGKWYFCQINDDDDCPVSMKLVR